MEYFAKIIHKTHLSYLPTFYPVQFYGMPNGKVFFVYARDSEIKTVLEFVFAEHKEFSYDYVNHKLMMLRNGKIEKAISNEMIDKPGPEYLVFKVSRSIGSYSDAFHEINLMAKELLDEIIARRTVKLNLKFRKDFRSNVS
jgi:hypothetical protein